MKNENQASSPLLGRMFLFLLFPPYGLYVFLFKTKVRWYVKVPVSLIVAVFFILAIDQSLNPYRVEDVQAEKVIISYLEKHPDEHMGTFRKSERNGMFRWKNESFISFRTLTMNGLYDFVVKSNKDGTYTVDSIYQTYPTQLWKKESSTKLPAYPMAMSYFYEHREELGELKSSREEKNFLKIETTKGEYRYRFAKNRVISVEKETGEIILQEKDEYDVPPIVRKYFKKNEAKLGKISSIFGYEMDTQKESYHLRTEKGRYRVDCFDDRNIELLKANE